ncbi:MAG: carboxypeptidase-like regulatory domain-containing protein [Mucilaginibacter sp.]|uniref:carboxypeptidase-like regulatory domain-containing protein n=1 Tax=Mucilaginibacter sp. TaxID=1882438 RepID=UPI003263B1DA
MKKYTIAILLIALPALLKAQIITGKVIRMGDKSIIANASVYFSGSVKGTRTDSLGMFKLFTTQTNVPIIVSCVGYYSETITGYTPGKLYEVYLKPKENIMRMVQIGDDGMSRAGKVAIFKREFLGTSTYGLNCIITNMDDIDLDYSKKKDELTASCNNPIIIKNKLLGYTITYYLDNFSRTSAGVLYAGNYLFKEDMPLGARDVKKIQKERERAYSDSRMHLIRAIWSRTVDASDFTIYDSLYEKIKVEDILVANEKGDKFINLKGAIHITYKGNSRYITNIKQKEAYSYVNERGFYGTGLAWSGAMSTQRIGDMLPFEYVSPQDIIPQKSRIKQ